LFVQKQTCAFRCDGLQGHLELIVTIAAKRMKDFACHALRMNAN
jgi:hypothetical protein